MHKKFIPAILNILTLCVIISAISIYFINNHDTMGFILIILSLICVSSLIPFKIKFKTILPDIFFGIIDNGILSIMAIFGGHLAGVVGAIMGGVVGNAITDGIAGIFEGYYAEKLRWQLISEERTMLKSAVGKMAGCLLGAGVVLVVANLINFNTL